DLRTSRLISIVGAGGVGKTTVALAVAERAIGAFVDGVWLVDFAPLREPSLVPHAIASALGLVVHSANVLAALSRFVRDRQLLLVLDNCEHMLPAIAACVERLLPEAPDVHVLTTSRAALRVPGEQVHKLVGLAAPALSTGLTAEGALAYPAVELFVERATDRLETFVLEDGDAPALADICRSLDGIALAIELAAMRVDVFGVKGLQKQLDDRFRLLAGRRAGLERHRTLSATLDWSYSLLPVDEARLLRAVAVFPGAFRLAGASSASELGPGQAAAILMELASKSLLAVELDAPETSYRLLETTRAYCLEKLDGAGEEPRVRHRHAEYVCTVLERAAGEWKQQLSRDWGAVYGSYLDDLRAALAWAGADPARRSLQIRLTAAGTLLWNHFSLTDESRIHLTRAIAELGEAGSENTAVEMNLQFALAGAILYTRGIVPEARVALRRVLQISEQLADTDFRLRFLRLTGTYELFGGEHDAGIRTLESFVSIAGAEDPSALAEGETHLGAGEIFVGRLQSALKRAERLAAQCSQDFNDARFARFQYSNSVNVSVVLCHAQWLTGDAEAAAQTAELVLEYGRQAAHELSLSIALAWASLVYLWLGREEECGRHAAMLDELVERHGIVTWRPVATFCRGAVAALRQPADGIDELRRAVAEFRAIGHMARLPYYIAVLAEALAKAARFEEAELTIREAMELATVQNEKWCAAEVLRICAFIAAAQGQRERAEAVLRESIASAAAVGALSWQLRAAKQLAELAANVSGGA
ncbi:MAG TPA: AAA family ATPase, partial [Polyangiales bacterium]|nr:AAA family ATPase [Polyangiales bacterium]